MTIKVLKLISGEEIIAREEGQGTQSRPRVLQMMQTERGMGAGLVPFIVSAPDETVTINQMAIVTVVDAPMQIETAYLQQTSSIDLTSKL